MPKITNKGALSGRKSSDEFFTKYPDVEAELDAMLDDDPDVFRDKRILLPANDAESSFFEYLANNKDRAGFREIVGVGYVPDGKGRIRVLDPNGERVEQLEGSGDFKSDEVARLLDRCDMVLTNPPFSCMRKFADWVIGSGKLFAFIIGLNHLTYYEVFPHIMDGSAWFGYRKSGLDMTFRTNGGDRRIGSISWLTNIPRKSPVSKPLDLVTMDENIQTNKRFRNHCLEKFGKVGYFEYDNYPAIEVPWVSAIPSDYSGVMGVPVTYLGKHDPDRFEILGIWKTNSDPGLSDHFVRGEAVPRSRTQSNTKYRSGSREYVVNYTGPVVMGQEVFIRVLIRPKRSNV